MIRIAVTAVIWLIPQVVVAQTAMVEVTIQGVNSEAKEITVSYKAGTGEKSISLDVSRKAEISLNGEKVDLGALGPGQQATVEYHRELAIVTKIEALANPEDDGWITLFDGQSLKGWKADQLPHVWRIEDNAIVGRGKSTEISHLHHERSLVDFEFKAEIKINADGNSGVFLRARQAVHHDMPMADGYEIQIAGSSSQARTGSLNATARGQGSNRHIATVSTNLIKDDEWFTLHAIVRDNRITVNIDEQQVLDARDPKNQHVSGTIAIQHYRADTHVSLRRIAVKPLP